MQLTEAERAKFAMFLDADADRDDREARWLEDAKLPSAAFTKRSLAGEKRHIARDLRGEPVLAMS